MFEHRERTVCLVQMHADCGRLDRDLPGDREKLFGIGARVRGHAANFTLVEKLALIVERRNLRQVNSRNRKDPTAIERAKCRWDEFARGREENRRVERRGRRRHGIADPVGAELLGQLAMNAAATHHEDATIPMFEHLNRQVRGTAETVEPYGRAGENAGTLDRAISDDSRAKERRGVLVADIRRQ